MEKQILLTLPIKEFKTLICECIRSEMAIQAKEAPRFTEYIGSKEAASILRISRPTLRKYTDNSLLKSYRVGNTLRYRRNEIDASLRSMNSIKYSRNEI